MMKSAYSCMCDPDPRWRCSPPGQREAGFGLVDVLVALLVLSLGLLGHSLLQGLSVRNTQSADLRAQAALYAQDMIDRIQANRLEIGHYPRTPAHPIPDCDMRANCDIREWRQQLLALPQGRGGIAFDPATSTLTVTVIWNDARAGGNANSQLVLSTRL